MGIPKSYNSGAKTGPLSDTNKYVMIRYRKLNIIKILAESGLALQTANLKSLAIATEIPLWDSSKMTKLTSAKTARKWNHSSRKV